MGFPVRDRLKNLRKLGGNNILIWILSEKARQQSLSYSRKYAKILLFVLDISVIYVTWSRLWQTCKKSADFEQILRSEKIPNLNFTENVAPNDPRSRYMPKKFQIFLPTDRPTPAGGGPETAYLIRMALKSMKDSVRGLGCLEHRFNPAIAPGKVIESTTSPH
jgi:hypothetical protein